MRRREGLFDLGALREASRRAALTALWVALWGGALGAAQPQAEFTRRDLETVGRALAFLERPPTGPVVIGVVYPGSSAAGRAEADRIASTIGDGLEVRPIVLMARPLTVEEVAFNTDVVALLLTAAALPAAERLASAIAGRGVLTIVSDPTIVEAGRAVMAVRTSPRVEIAVNRSAARAAGVGFAPAFRMMIHER